MTWNTDCVETCAGRRPPSKRATGGWGLRDGCDWVPVRKVPSISSGFRASRAPAIQFRAFLGRCEKAEDGPRTFPFQDAGAAGPSETLPALLRLDFSNTTGASALRAASNPITDGRRSLVIRMAAMASTAVFRSLAATAPSGWPP